jgi:hypothetical protein
VAEETLDKLTRDYGEHLSSADPIVDTMVRIRSYFVKTNSATALGSVSAIINQPDKKHNPTLNIGLRVELPPIFLHPMLKKHLKTGTPWCSKVVVRLIACTDYEHAIDSG